MSNFDIQLSLFRLNPMFGFFKKNNASTAPVQQSTPSVNTMNVIDSAVMNHLNMNTNGALMVTGDWGSGKTYYIKTKLFPEIKEQTKLKPIIVSVYGAKDKESIAQKVVFTYWDSHTSNKLSTQKITQGLTKLAAAIPFITKYVNVEKILTANGENLLKLLPHDDLVISFDDVERLSDKLDINDFLGLVNELVENRRAKVILIANAKKFRKPCEEEQAEKKLIYLEKTVEKTVHYNPDMSVVLDNVFEEYEAGAYQDFLKKNKTWLLNTLNVSTEDKELKELKVDLVNIRTIKFAIEHFRLVFEAITTTKTPTEELTEQQLQSAWLFVIGLSVAFRSGNYISFDNTNHLEEPEPILADLDIDFSKARVLSGAPEPETPQADPHAFAKRFKREFYGRLDEPYHFYDQIFRLITGGQAIDASALSADLDQQFYTEEGKVNPAQALIDQFVTGGWWNFSDADFKPALEKLLEYSRGGEFGNPVSYLNASVFLFGFRELLGKSEDQIVAEIKSGLDIYFSRMPFSHYIETQFSISRSHFTEEHAQQLVTYMKDKFKRSAEETEKDAAAALEQLFINDIKQFVQETLHPSNPIRTPSEPVFNFFGEASIDEGLKNWEPSGIMDLASFMEMRYKANSFVDRLRYEQPFLEKLMQTLQAVKDEEKPLSVHLIQKELLPKLDKAIAVLKSLPQLAGEAVAEDEDTTE